MKKNRLQRSKRWISGAAAGFVTLGAGDLLVARPGVNLSDPAILRLAKLDRFSRGYENVLGTSLDLIVEAHRPADAMECETRILAEIERLRRILSPYDPSSEISRVMAGAPVVSAELTELLAAYKHWSIATDGLIEINLGGVVDVWRAAQTANRLPESAALMHAARQERAFKIDALGKGYIIDRAVAVARRVAPAGVLNLGGDLRAWGDTTWTVGVADPRNPADNAAPIACFALREAAVATSGGYARFYQIDGKKYSHLIDPRSGWAIESDRSASFVAADSVTANALATAATIGGPDVAEDLARVHGAAGYVFANETGIVSSASTLAATAAGAAAPSASPAPAPTGPAKYVAAPAGPGWPADFQMNVQVVLKNQGGGRGAHRPYAAVWIQNAKGQVVRTVTVWGSDDRWQRKLTTWWNLPAATTFEAKVPSRATRVAGTYNVVWDGLDDFGRRLPMDTYTVGVEICREHGYHVFERIEVKCGAEPVTAAIHPTGESEASVITYGPVKS